MLGPSSRMDSMDKHGEDGRRSSGGESRAQRVWQSRPRQASFAIAEHSVYPSMD